jgi:hypothetical protein
MAQHPLRTAGNILVRVLRLASVNPGRVEHDALVADGFPSRLVIAWLALEWLLLAVLAAVGVRTGGTPEGALPFATAIAGPYVLVLALTYVQTRYRLPLVPLLALFAAPGLASLLDARSRTGTFRRAVPAALIACVVVLGATVVELALKTR